MTDLLNQARDARPLVLAGALDAGTWTPTVGGSTTNGTIAYTTQTGTWKRVGPLVFASFTILTSSVSAAPTGNLQVQGLPTAARNSNPNGAVIVTYCNITTLLRGYVPAGGTACQFADSSGTLITGAVMTGVQNIQGMAVYEVE